MKNGLERLKGYGRARPLKAMLLPQAILIPSVTSILQIHPTFSPQEHKVL